MPEPASSYMVGNAPQGASYAAPLVNFSPISQFPQDYFQGQQRQRTLQLQNAFPDGLPRDPNTGEIDVGQITDKLAKIGGADYATQLMPFLFQSQMAREAGGAVSGTNWNGAPAQPATQSDMPAAGPASIRGTGAPAAPAAAPTIAPPAAAAPRQPTLSSVGTDDQGQDTLRSIATEVAGGRDVSPVIARAAAFLKIDPDAPLPADKAQIVRQRFAQIMQAGSNPQGNAVTGGGAPVTPVGGTGGNGAPGAGTGNAPETAAPASGIVPQVPPGGAPQGAAVPGVPPGQDPAQYANGLLNQATMLHARASRWAAFKGGEATAQSIENQAKALETRAQGIFDYMQKVQEPYATAGADIYKGVGADAAKSAATKLAGVAGAANQYEGDLKPKIDVARSLLNDPRMWTGTGGDLSLALNRAKNLGFGDRAAMLQEVLNKVTASSILSQINGLKDMMMQAGGASSSAGRIFQQQVELMNKASPQLGTTLEGNRALVEIEARTGEQAVAIRNLALDYLGPPDQNGVPTRHKFLDAGFDRLAANYLRGHPLFTQDELAHPEYLGVPTAPASIRDTGQRQAWAQGIGLKAGDPFRAPNGKYTYYKGLPQPPSPGGAQAAPAPQQ